MKTPIDPYSREIADICRRHGVRRLSLFGSAARPDFAPQSSDFDFLVEFLTDDWQGAADRWFGLLEDLESLLGRKVDLTSAKTATNPYFLQSITPDRVEVYAA